MTGYFSRVKDISGARCGDVTNFDVLYFSNPLHGRRINAEQVIRE
jgi:hypothetical protein